MTGHADAAKRHLDSVVGHGASASQDQRLQAALVEATLELAAQQRARNLLAYERLHLGRPDQDGERPLLSVPPTPWLEEVESLLDIAEVGDRRAS